MRLVEVEPIAGDTYEEARYVSCDLCYENACADIWAGRLAERDWRQFFKSLDDGGIIVCGNCLPAYLAELDREAEGVLTRD